MKTPPNALLSPVEGPTSTSDVMDKQLIGRRMIRETAFLSTGISAAGRRFHGL